MPGANVACVDPTFQPIVVIVAPPEQPAATGAPRRRFWGMTAPSIAVALSAQGVESLGVGTEIRHSLFLAAAQPMIALAGRLAPHAHDLDVARPTSLACSQAIRQVESLEHLLKPARGSPIALHDRFDIGSAQIAFAKDAIQLAAAIQTINFIAQVAPRFRRSGPTPCLNQEIDEAAPEPRSVVG
jgi:hypothetical protein